jgi:lipopolysaccharide biosynthesis glycosyltransferase
MIVEDNVSKETDQQIRNEGCLIKHIQALNPNVDPSHLIYERFIFSWTKLRAFELTDIADKCVFLDCDMIILQNLDELFQLEDNPDFAAVQTCICNPGKNKTYPEHWIPTNCPYTSENFSIIDHQGKYFNSGLFLFHPNKKTFEEILKCLNTWDLTQLKFPDQDFLNKFYQKKWKCLPSIYNSLKTFSITHPNIWDLSKIKIIHYILAKPWDKTDENNQLYENINQLWWEALEFKSN